ncbi:uncharacterized protein B0P05DRAFT_536375 [Gilbertella persicaria]|uniref:Nedd4 interacting protein n=1 Tax=Rhizopus stolonifer TaxID=4846 RepID=A0A367KTL0_RHIST|nr:uncharacterized protein B0P05DRAFT_536375 [Gilbertella persicaria]KAI8084160.1 hypothetical protein B0P05DRAFT_536375 [Gilbertella persicaria]RCI05539.1 Nedd4 interacting protein [Rhizopus stolonifer]
MVSNRGYEQVPLDNHEEQLDRPPSTQRRTDLEDTFDISEDEQDNIQPQTEYHQLLPHNAEQRSSTSTVQQHSTDGVFSNMAAKPESDTKLEEIPPSYEEASADATPPYWQTTVIAPVGMGDIILVEGLPVGSIFSFMWNLMVSASFQLVGFMLTYLLHTTHAAKDGARAGLGISLIQYGFYVRSRGTLDEDFDYDGEGHETVGQDATQAKIIAYIMMFIGWFIILRALSDFNKARKMEKIITSEPTAINPENIV